ncbi:hypothetical protein NDU88_006014 [Pleurodeles waltl]|uniref:Uncharacterized protein n=1 Tax=Pleurodeles waltl TaxID=8319 RepID=A0AAV7NP30_PLEWA|nr:hypothetical protein NDU88_006014 [Pleurodeles waltl]
MYFTFSSVASCDGPAGTNPHTKPTCADAACGVQEHHWAGTNEGRVSGTTREGGGTKSSVSAEQGGKENDEEERDGDEEEERAQRIAEPGEWLLPSRGEEDEEAADGGLKTAVALGGRILNPATLLEKRGISRCVTTPY